MDCVLISGVWKCLVRSGRSMILPPPLPAKQYKLFPLFLVFYQNYLVSSYLLKIKHMFVILYRDVKLYLREKVPSCLQVFTMWKSAMEGTRWRKSSVVLPRWEPHPWTTKSTSQSKASIGANIAQLLWWQSITLTEFEAHSTRMN